MQKKIWAAPKLEELEVEKTLTGPTPLDAEALFLGVNQNLGGPPS